MNVRVIEGVEAETFDRTRKWAELSPYLRQHGREALSYASLQDGMEYFVIDGVGYIAYVSIRHPIFAPSGMKMVLVDPVCAVDRYELVVRSFMKHCKRIAFAPASEELGYAIRGLGFKFVCIGYEPVIPIQTYNVDGNWRELDMIRRARNQARRDGITVREEREIGRVDVAGLEEVSKRWLSNKVLRDREIWVYARSPVYENEPDVRKFVAYDRSGRILGYVFYDPIYRGGKVVGYSANTARCDEINYGKLSTVIHMAAMRVFRSEGKEILNLCLAPFDKVDNGRFQDDPVTKWFFKLTRRYGENVYNFGGLSFFKSRFRAPEISKYFASNALFPANDVYLAYRSSGIVENYSKMMADFFTGLATGLAADFRRRWSNDR